MYRAQDAETIEGYQHALNPVVMLIGGLSVYQTQIVGVAGCRVASAMHGQIQHRVHRGVGSGMQNPAGVTAYQSLCQFAIAFIDRHRQLTDQTTEAAASAQHDGLLCQRR